VSQGGGTVVFSRNTLDGPDQLLSSASEGKAARITDVDADKLADVQFSPFEAFTFAGWNGESVHGYVVKPYGYKPGQKYPVVYLIHGGPQAHSATAGAIGGTRRCGLAGATEW